MTAHTLALYNSGGASSLTESCIVYFLSFVEKWFSMFKAAPEYCAVFTKADNSSGFKEKKISFRKLTTQHFNEPLIGVSMRFFDTKLKPIDHSKDYKIAFDISTNKMVMSYVHTDIVVSLEQIIDEVYPFFLPEYGFADKIATLDPSAYAIGLPIGSQEIMRDLNLSNLLIDTQCWVRSFDVHPPTFQQGVFRRVYKNNLINESHLKLYIDNLSFARWIIQHNAGSVKEIKSGLYLLRVNEEYINLLSMKLFEQGKTIIGWGKKQGYHWITDKWLDYQPLI